MNRYDIGFGCGDYWNGIAGVCGLRRAKELAAEIAKEYGEMPEIRKVEIEKPSPDEPHFWSPSLEFRVT